jgi:hypothetical protein
MRIVHVVGGSTEGHPDFARLLLTHELTMTLALVEAFLGDSLRAMCRREPRILRRSKQITWEEVVDAGNWDFLLARLVEAFAYDFGWKSLRDKVVWLGKEHGLKLVLAEPELAAMDGAEQTRHLIVHNGGRASAEYLERTGRTDVAVGTLVPIDSGFVEAFHDVALYLCGEVYAAIAMGFFGEPADPHTGVVRFPRPLSRSG